MYSQNFDTDLWNSMKSRYGPSKLEMLKSGSLKIKDKTMNFQYRTIGSKPQTGYTLIFGLHGGGSCPKDVNDGQYNNHKNLYNNYLPQGCIWFTPRSIQDTWDMWWKDYMEDFILQIIRAFSLNDLIDINKVFISGYSAGGDGVYHLAPRLADHLAGAAMMAGHPNGINFMNIRNIGFSIQVGGEDNAYNRKNQAIKYIRMLNQLGQNYGGFQHQSKIHQGKPHWMGSKDAEVFSWLLSKSRDPYPNIILYRETPRRTKQQFYYIRIGKSWGGQKNEETIVFKQGNNFTIFSNRTITILVNKKMVNPYQLITVVHNGQKTCQKIIQMRKQVIQKTLLERIDPFYMFQDQLESNPPSVIDISSVICSQFNISKDQKSAEYQPSLNQDPEKTPSNFSFSVEPLAKKKNERKNPSLHYQQIAPQIFYFSNQLTSQPAQPAFQSQIQKRPSLQFQNQPYQPQNQPTQLQNQSYQPWANQSVPVQPIQQAWNYTPPTQQAWNYTQPIQPIQPVQQGWGYYQPIENTITNTNTNINTNANINTNSNTNIQGGWGWNNSQNYTNTNINPSIPTGGFVGVSQPTTQQVQPGQWQNWQFQPQQSQSQSQNPTQYRY